MLQEKSQKVAQYYYCEKCDYKCSKKSDFNKHIKTNKHNATICYKDAIKNSHYCLCGKTYKHTSSFFRHKKICKIIKENEEKGEIINQEKEEEIINQEKDDVIINQEDIDYKQLLFKMMEQNNELQQTILGQQETIKEMIPTIGNNNNNTTNNNQFNIQLFLNEDCKDALNIKDFVNSLQLTIKDLTDTGRLGYVDGLSRIFVNALNDMDIRERPIHCTDLKRETVYIKDADKWEKDQEENSKLKKTIRAIENKNLRMIPKWQEENPKYNQMGSNESEEFMQLSITALGGNEEKGKQHKKIVKNVLREVLIDKNKT